jgi:hypothetical protein
MPSPRARRRASAPAPPSATARQRPRIARSGRLGRRKPDIPVAAASGSWAVRACRPNFRFRVHIGRTAIDYDVCHISMLESARVSANRQDIFSRRLTEQANISNEVLELWFDPANRRYWFEASPDFDELVRQRLINLYASAAEGCLDDWKDEPNGALALCILFDQVPRNIFRGSPQAFATDPQALSVARHMLTLGFDLMPDRRSPRALLPAFRAFGGHRTSKAGCSAFERKDGRQPFYRLCPASFGNHR